MLNKSMLIRFLSLSLAVAGFLAVSGNVSETQAQTRDPFAKPGWAQPRNPTTSSPGQPRADKPKPPGPPPVVAILPPSIEQRISYYKQLREAAVANGSEVPKVTSVLTIDEMSVIGIFRTPRGVAAMVEAKPIKLSYTIYPGEKFFDGQLVAVEDNRLVFRRVVKMSNNKFISSVENKTLRQFSVEQEVQGTAPVQPTEKTGERTEQQADNTMVMPMNPQVVNAPTIIISPFEEMLKQPAEPAEKTVKETPGKKGKKPVKVADNKKQ